MVGDSLCQSGAPAFCSMWYRVIKFAGPSQFPAFKGARWDLWSFTETPPDSLNVSHSAARQAQTPKASVCFSSRMYRHDIQPPNTVNIWQWHSCLPVNTFFFLSQIRISAPVSSTDVSCILQCVNFPLHMEKKSSNIGVSWNTEVKWGFATRIKNVFFFFNYVNKYKLIQQQMGLAPNILSFSFHDNLRADLSKSTRPLKSFDDPWSQPSWGEGCSTLLTSSPSEFEKAHCS